MTISGGTSQRVERDTQIGDVRVEYCAARRGNGDWFAVGTVIHRNGAPDRISPLVAGVGKTELLAVEQMLSGLSERRNQLTER